MVKDFGYSHECQQDSRASFMIVFQDQYFEIKHGKDGYTLYRLNPREKIAVCLTKQKVWQIYKDQLKIMQE